MISIANHSPQYRPDIDGLRAIAVISVVLFHADFALASGGFIGVDIFFVISGYLISSILLREFPAGWRGLGQFYERRARRIIPAITAMVIAVVIGGVLLFPPNQLILTAKAVLATQLFGANFYFWQTAGYFAPESALNPLTHMWSLGVEEQFYLIFPICLWGTTTFFSRFRLAIIITIAVLSFALSWWLTFNHPPSAFYLLPARAWELLLGSALALTGGRWTLPQSYRQVMGATGAVLIVAGLAVIDRKTPFPGVYALLPAFGTAALLAAGGGVGSAVTRLLSSSSLVAIGLRSYSIYLWHWPVLVWTKTWTGDINPGPWSVTAAILCALLLAEISYRLIERPFRERGRIALSSIVYGFAATSIFLAAWSVAIVGQQGMPWRFSQQVVQLDADANAYSAQSMKCFGDSSLESFATIKACKLGAVQQRLDFVLWGDSHAGAIAPAISKLAQDRGRSGYLAAMSSCPPFQLYRTRTPATNAETCEQNNRDVLHKILASNTIQTVFLFASWQRYYDEDADYMVDSIVRLSAALKLGGKTVLLIHGMPRPDIPVPWTLARYKAAGKPQLVLPRPIEPWLTSVTTNSGIITANLSNALCTADACALSRNGRALYVDGSHLSQPANDLVIAPWLTTRFVDWPQ